MKNKIITILIGITLISALVLTGCGEEKAETDITLESTTEAAKNVLVESDNSADFLGTTFVCQVQSVEDTTVKVTAYSEKDFEMNDPGNMGNQNGESSGFVIADDDNSGFVASDGDNANAPEIPQGGDAVAPSGDGTAPQGEGVDPNANGDMQAQAPNGDMQAPSGDMQMPSGDAQGADAPEMPEGETMAAPDGMNPGENGMNPNGDGTMPDTSMLFDTYDLTLQIEDESIILNADGENVALSDLAEGDYLKITVDEDGNITEITVTDETALMEEIVGENGAEQPGGFVIDDSTNETADASQDTKETESSEAAQ